MQGWGHPIDTITKVNYLNQLLQVGIDTLDCGSFVSPKAIPQMADTKDVLPQLNLENTKIAVIGLGYVGLPLTIEFAKYFNVVGFDINQSRIEELKSGFDRTKEVPTNLLEGNKKLFFTTDKNDINDCNVFIITVPTPLDQFKSPDLKPLINASKTVGSILKNNDIVILEDFQMEAPKTKNFVNIMNNLKIADKKSLLVLAGMSEAIYLSSRNLQKAKVVSASDINTYDLLNADKLVLTSGSVKTIEESLSK